MNTKHNTPITLILLLLTSLFSSACSQNKAQYHTLISNARNLNVKSTTLTPANFPSTQSGDWSVKLETLHGGKSEGVQLITLDNGAIQIRIIPTRGMSIYDVKHKDIRLGWNSPIKEIVNPAYINLESRGGLGWVEGFNEWLVRCGLEFAGHPGKDSFTTNTGDTAEMDLSLHGKIGNIPASEVSVHYNLKSNRIAIRGTVYENVFFGPKLKLTTEISTTPGSNTFRISDTITNQGSSDQEFTLIYHANFGKPILGDGAKVIAPVKKITPMNDHAQKGLNTYNTYGPPTPGYIEQVFLIEPHVNDQSLTQTLLHNPATTRGVLMEWNTKQLPFLTLWKNTVAESDGYVTGIEPGTNYPYNRKVEREAGRLPSLKPNQTRRFDIDVTILNDKDAIQKAADNIIELTH